MKPIPGHTQETYKVTLYRPENVSVSAMDKMIREAILSWVLHDYADSPFRIICRHPVRVIKENI